MDNKDKIIEEMAKEIFNTCAWRFGNPNDYKEIFNDIAEDLTKLNYLKIDKDSVVLTEKERQFRDYECYNLGYENHRQESQKREDYIVTLEHHINDLENALLIARKETAKKIIERAKSCGDNFYIKICEILEDLGLK